MIGNVSRRERNLIGLALAAVVVVGGWTFGVQPVRERHRAAAELMPVREQVLARRQALVARKPAIFGELEATDKQIAQQESRFLLTATPAVAASELQKIVKDIAVQTSMEVRSERILPPVEREGLLEIPIEITVSGEIRQLVDLLSKLEQTPKLLSVQDLKIRVVNVAQPKDLLATLTLSGFILPAKART